MEKLELRLQEPSLETNDENEMIVSGYVNKTNQWSQVLGQRNKFVERISKGAFKRAIERAKEIRFLAEHDNEKILASTKNGSLTLREDETGLWMSAKITDTSWGRDYHTLIKDGIIENMSFGMRVTKQKWDKRNDGISERTVYDLELTEVSAVKNPAYIQSTLNARSIELIEDVGIPQEDDKKEQSKMENRELTIEEQIKLKESYIRKLEKINDDAETQRSIDGLKSELRNLKAQLPVNQKAVTQKTETNEERAIENWKTPGNMIQEKELSNSIINGSKYPLLAGMFDIFEGKSKHRKLFGYDDAEADFYNKDAAPPEQNNSNLAEIDFEQKRLLTSLGISEQTFNDSALNFTSYVNDLFAVRNLKTFQSQAFGKGDAGNDFYSLHFQSIFDYNLLPEKNEKTAPGTVTLINNKKITELTGVTVENINAIYDEYDDENMAPAVLVVDSRSVLSGLKDDAGNPLLKRENRINGSIGTVYGRPVMVQSMNGKGKMVLMNPKAYGVSVNAESKTFPVSGDTTQALQAARLFISQVYAMGKVVNPYAIKIIK